ncbi:MAG: sugar ABC transporter permease YjfF [Methylotenera sp.]|nr:sugar ABC transporter permease YjfF [Oligoflexia bacterium]
MARLPKLQTQFIPILATLATFLLLGLMGSLRYTGFLSPGVFLNLVDDNAFLGIAAIGMTFVILSGGIDLSVGSVIGLTSIVSATLVEKHHVPPGVVIPLVLALGTLLGAGMGALIRFFELAPFLVTLAGMFLARGIALMISLESIQLTNPFYQAVSAFRVPLGGALGLPANGLVFLGVLGFGIYLASYTRFGRNTYALGGSDSSALLMGLPVGRTKIGVYALSGFCSALAGVVYTFYTSSGNASAAGGLELDAIAAVVIGGTLLSGGSGYILGTWLGVLILGMIQTAISFENTLSSWWTKIIIGGLLFAFIVIQRSVIRPSSKTA